MKSSRLDQHAKALRKATIDARRIKHTVRPRELTAAELGKYIPAGRLRNIPEGNR